MFGLTASASAQTPPVPARTSVPGHPLQVVFGPTPGSATSFAGPNTEGLPTLSGAEALRREFGSTVPTAVPGFRFANGTGVGGRNKFNASVDFAGDDGVKNFRLLAWTKTGDFIYAAPANSPVTDVQQTKIGELHALTLMPTPAVVGGLGPRTIYMTDGKVIWLLEPNGYTDNAEALALARTIAGIITTPGAPSVGNAADPEQGDASVAMITAGFALLAVAIGGGAMLLRRKR